MDIGLFPSLILPEALISTIYPICSITTRCTVCYMKMYLYELGENDLYEEPLDVDL